MNWISYGIFSQQTWLFSTLILLTTSSAQALSCTSYLALDFEIQSTSEITSQYSEYEPQLEIFVQENSPRKIVTLFKSFKKSYHQRYEVYLETILKSQPEIASQQLNQKMSGFKALEEKHLEFFLNALKKIPNKKRIHYLKSLDINQLHKITHLLDALLGIEYTQLAQESEKESDWIYILNAINIMNLTTEDQVSDFDSNFGRLGLMIGVLKPETKFVGLQSTDENTKILNRIAFENGFTNVKFQKANLSDQNMQLPSSDHWGIFSLTALARLEFFRQKIIENSKVNGSQIYFAYPSEPPIFFEGISSSHIDHVTIFDLRN